MQYYDTGKFGIIFVLLMVAFILLNIKRAKGEKGLFIRRIPGLNAIDEAIGRATEMGKPVLMVPGIGDETQIGVTAQALTIFAYITRTAIRFGTPIRLCCANATTYALAQEIIRDVYQTEGMMDRMEVESVQFISDRQFAFAAGVSGLIHRERTAATFFLGAFYAESLIFAETANSIGAIQVAGSTQNTQTPFFIAACDYVLIADEFYAASAYLSREPVLVGSLVGQDWSKLLIMALIFVGFLANSVQRTQEIDEKRTADGRWIADEAHKRKASETFLHSLFNPAAKVRGVKVEKTFASLDAYVQERKQELGAQADPIPGGEDEIREQKGQWFRWEVVEDELTRPIEDFVVIAPDGSVLVTQEWRGRRQRPETEMPPAGEGGEAV
jgi:hypothetical protein